MAVLPLSLFTLPETNAKAGTAAVSSSHSISQLNHSFAYASTFLLSYDVVSDAVGRYSIGIYPIGGLTLPNIFRNIYLAFKNPS